MKYQYQISVFKKTIWLSLAMTVSICVLTACSGPGKEAVDEADGQNSPIAAVSEPLPEKKPDMIAYSAQGVVFDVQVDWTQAEGADMFYTADNDQVYGLNGASSLGSYTPQDFLEQLKDFYQSENEFDSLDVLSDLHAWESADGVPCQAADLQGDRDSILYCTKVVIAPQKNLVLTFCAQSSDSKDAATVWDTLNMLCDSLRFEIGSQDYITGNTFTCSDGSQLCLQDDQRFFYYRSEDDHENQYYDGTYEVYYGQAAMDKVASMTEYGLTEQELEQILLANMNGYVPGESTPMDYFYSMGDIEDTRTRYSICRDTFYAVILHNDHLVRSPEDIIEAGNSVLYLGFYIPELNMADLTNANALSYTQWTFQKKTETG